MSRVNGPNVVFDAVDDGSKSSTLTSLSRGSHSVTVKIPPHPLAMRSDDKDDTAPSPGGGLGGASQGGLGDQGGDGGGGDPDYWASVFVPESDDPCQLPKTPTGVLYPKHERQGRPDPNNRNRQNCMKFLSAPVLQGTKKFGINVNTSALFAKDNNDYRNSSPVARLGYCSDLRDQIVEIIHQADGLEVFLIPTTLINVKAKSIYEIFGRNRLHLLIYFSVLPWKVIVAWQELGIPRLCAEDRDVHNWFYVGLRLSCTKGLLEKLDKLFFQLPPKAQGSVTFMYLLLQHVFADDTWQTDQLQAFIKRCKTLGLQGLYASK